MKTENLRNKYKNHPIIKPIIEYCDRNEIGFEIVKDTKLAGFGIKSFYVNSYYMTIGDHLIEDNCCTWYWSDLFSLIITAYKYLGLEYPDNLVKAARAFKVQI